MIVPGPGAAAHACPAARGARPPTPRARGRALAAYAATSAVGHLAWEGLQLPLYTIWTTATPRAQAFAVLHCTLGDLLIAAVALALALGLAGDRARPSRRAAPVALLTVLAGVAYTVFSEWLNVTVRGSWAYADAMPVLSVLGFRLGLSPVLQWVVVPALALLAAARAVHADESGRGDGAG